VSPRMEPETANIAPPPRKQTKLSKLQKMILTDLYKQSEEYLKYLIKYKDWAAEYTLEMVTYAFAINSKGLSWRIARLSEGKTHLTRDEVKADFMLRKAKALDSISGPSLPFLGFATRVWNERQRRGSHPQLLPSFRASMSRGLKRLEARGLVNLEKGEGQDWRSDNRKPKTTGIYLTPLGLEVASQLPPREC